MQGRQESAFCQEEDGDIDCDNVPLIMVLPTRAKFTTSMEFGIVWPPTWFELARVGLNLIKLKFLPNKTDHTSLGWEFWLGRCTHIINSYTIETFCLIGYHFQGPLPFRVAHEDLLSFPFNQIIFTDFVCLHWDVWNANLCTFSLFWIMLGPVLNSVKNLESPLPTHP